MERHEIECLIRLAQAGNKSASAKIAEWGLDAALRHGSLPLLARLQLKARLADRQNRRMRDFRRVGDPNAQEILAREVFLQRQAVYWQAAQASG